MWFWLGVKIFLNYILVKLRHPKVQWNSFNYLREICIWNYHLLLKNYQVWTYTSSILPYHLLRQNFDSEKKAFLNNEFKTIEKVRYICIINFAVLMLKSHFSFVQSFLGKHKNFPVALYIYVHGFKRILLKLSGHSLCLMGWFFPQRPDSWSQQFI